MYACVRYRDGARQSRGARGAFQKVSLSGIKLSGTDTHHRRISTDSDSNDSKHNKVLKTAHTAIADHSTAQLPQPSTEPIHDDSALKRRASNVSERSDRTLVDPQWARALEEGVENCMPGYVPRSTSVVQDASFLHNDQAPSGSSFGATDISSFNSGYLDPGWSHSQVRTMSQVSPTICLIEPEMNISYPLTYPAVNLWPQDLQFQPEDYEPT